MRQRPVLLFALLTLLGLPALVVPSIPVGLSLLWPEEQRAFLQDGPGLLLSNAQLEELASLDTVGRERFISRFLDRDPLPETPENELQQGIERRRTLVERELAGWLDDRARLLFLHGSPRLREIVDCIEVFKPLEVWTYGTDRQLVLYRPKPGEPYRLWLPIDGKRVLYNQEMEYWLEQWEELRGRITGGRRFDRQICDQAEWVDEVTGIDGLFGFQAERVKNAEVAVMLEPPDDLRAWAAEAATTPVATERPLGPVELRLSFPERAGQRLLMRSIITLPTSIALEPIATGEAEELRLVAEGRFERDGKIFDDFRVRFQLPSADGTVPVVLVSEHRLRPEQEFLLRIILTEESTGKVARLSRGFVVPADPIPEDEPYGVPEEALIALGDELKKHRIAGHDSLILVPPEADVVFGLWRADALVTGNRIEKVIFLVDDQEQLTRRNPPFTAELRLPSQPREQVVRAEGYDAEGELVASDEVVLNQPRGELRVRIVEPKRGTKATATGSVQAKAEIVVPEERRVTAVTFSVNEAEQAVLERPPWEVSIEVPATNELTYLTVTAELDDGLRAEDVRFLNAPGSVEEIDINFVELYTTVTDRSGRPVLGLERDDFEVGEDGRPQALAKFELVEDLPLTLGIAIDTSGSMFESIREAQRAAVGFLDNIIGTQDRCFALAFADRPALLMQRTSDVGAVAKRLENLLANGATALHDAIVTSLYYFRGVPGRRALILLSDGEDTSSTVEYKEALEYAKRSGVAVYTIGLGIGKREIGVRRKLEGLADATGGRTFYIKDAVELVDVYDEIENELRSQYLLAYRSDRPGGDGTYREITVEVEGGKLKARTIRGYYS